MHEQTPQRRTSGNYPLPGTETFYHTTVKDVPVEIRLNFPVAQAGFWSPETSVVGSIFLLVSALSDLTDFLYQRDRDYCIGMISSRW